MTTAAIVGGFGAFETGLWWTSPPLALMVGGVLLMVAGIAARVFDERQRWKGGGR